MTSTIRTLATTFATLLLLACGSEPELNVQQAAQEPDTAQLQSPQAAAEPGEPGSLPAGHPTLAPPLAAANVLPPVDAAAGTGAAALAWTAPAAWIAEPPANSMRRAQYRVPGSGGDGECVVFYFGPGQGGEALENAERWASQFSDATGQPATATMKTRTEQIQGVTVLFVEAQGTYHSGSMMGMGQVVAKPDWSLLGAVAEGADANWFFKFTGPQATVEAERAGFEAMLRSVKRGG